MDLGLEHEAWILSQLKDEKEVNTAQSVSHTSELMAAMTEVIYHLNLLDSFIVGYGHTIRYGYYVMVKKDLIKNSWNFLTVVAASLWVLFVEMISLLGKSAETPDSEESLSNSDRTGALNYRTGQLDDGTDPYGWYEND